MTFAPPTSAPVDHAEPLRWRLKWRGLTFREEDLTGEHLAVLASLNQRDEWSDLDVAGAYSPTLGPVRLMSMLTAFLVVRSGASTTEAIAGIVSMVAKASADELLSTLSLS